MGRRAFAGALLFATACVGPQMVTRAPVARPGLHAQGVRALADPTVRGARLLPENVAQARPFGEEPGGGKRAIVSGVRFVQWADGAMSAASDRLPPGGAAEQDRVVVQVPDRIGGGFLFASGVHLWRADAWLAAARPVFTAPNAIGSLLVGLDRVYVRTQGAPHGALEAIDPRTGALMDLGSLPATSFLSDIAALDAWRAVALVDLRGALLTLDAGSTWRPLGVPIDPTSAKAVGDAIVVSGIDAARQDEWWEIRADGQAGRLAAKPPQPDSDASGLRIEPTAHPFGDRPIIAAVEDGWPLSDGTVVVARDGALGRVRLSDGALVEAVPEAYPLRPSRCHAIALARPGDPGGFGFVCGEPRGATAVFRYDPLAARLVEERRFDDPREVVGSGNGGLAARGPCASSPDDVGPRNPHQAPVAALPGGEITWCVLAPGGARGWREIRFRGDDVDEARVVVLTDGRLALVRPPRSDDLSTARLTLTDGVATTHVPIALPDLRADVARALRLGAWMDGFEERRPGVLGGWVDAGGSVIGIEIDLDGQARVGEYLHDAGSPFVAGRWGFGWTASRRGFETTDGGMTWNKELDLPEPIAAATDVRERACGPVGCLVGGWLRIGWGGEPESLPPKEPATPRRPPQRDPPALDLTCTTASGPLPQPTARAATAPRSALRPIVPALPRPWLVPPMVPMASACVVQLAPFQGRPPPAMGADDCGVQLPPIVSPLDRGLSGFGMAQLYAWGPKGGDWDVSGRWKIAWSSTMGGWPEARATLSVPAPWTSREAAAHFLGAGGGTGAWSLVSADDPDHALLLRTSRQGSTRAVDVTALETDRPPAEVHRPGGEPFTEVLGAVRTAGRWYLATTQSANEAAATVVWAVDGSVAREMTRVPRLASEPLPTTRLAHRSDGGAIGLVVDGQPTLDRTTPPRWVVAIDLESGASAEPERLASLDFAGRASPLCTGDDAGWTLDLPYPSAVRVRFADDASAGTEAPETVLQQGTATARVRLSHASACIERVSGNWPRDARAVDLGRPPSRVRTGARTMDVSILASTVRYGLTCDLRR